jgi:hypothetical protein
MRLTTGRALAAAGLFLLGLSGLAVPGFAQDNVRLRGTIEQVEGDQLLIKTREGSDVKLKLAANPGIAAVTKASMADIKSGAYIGVGAMPQPDGSLLAISVHIFSEAMRGVAEGHRPWDLRPNSSMTNATVENVVTGVNGQTVTLKYKEGEQKIVIPPDLQIVAYVPGEVADLKAGARVFVGAAAKQPDGTLQTQRITVGRDANPPM